MPKAKNPITFSECYGLNSKDVESLGALDATLAIDTKLFVDPLLLEKSSHPEMQQAALAYKKRFSDIIKLLSASKTENDVPWRNAIRIMDFHEVSATGLGYGAGGVAGSGFGKALIHRIAKTGKSIVDLGISDPDLFSLLALFEEDIGADRISDMTTSIIVDELSEYTRRVCEALEVPMEEHTILGKTRSLPTNKALHKKSPTILVPSDCLGTLPIAADRSEICDAADKNQSLRNQVNAHVGMIWEVKTKKDKARLKSQILSDSKAMLALIAAYREIEATPYDSKLDPKGLTRWAKIAKTVSDLNPIELDKPQNKTEAVQVVGSIITHFKFLVEDKGLWKTLYHSGKRLPERYSQSLFFATAYSFCKANNLDVSPEVDTGTGLIDFKFSVGFSTRIVVEIKLSTNGKVVEGYTKQIARYNESEETSGGFYVIIDVGSMGRKDEYLIEEGNKARKEKVDPTTIVFVDALVQRSASKL